MDQLTQTRPELASAALAARALGLPSLVIIETPDSLKEAHAHIRHELDSAGFDEALDPKGLASALAKGNKVFYIEHGERLNARIETLFVEYVSGLASYPSLGVSARFDPSRATCVVALARAALESSYPDLLEYAGSVTSLG